MTIITPVFFVWFFALYCYPEFSAREIGPALVFSFFSNVVLILTSISYFALRRIKKYKADPFRLLLNINARSIYAVSGITMFVVYVFLTLAVVEKGELDEIAIYVAVPLSIAYALTVGIVIGLVISCAVLITEHVRKSKHKHQDI